MDQERLSDDFLGRFTAYAVKHRLLPDQDTVVVGVSGGIDSMCLLDLLQRLELRMHALHVNYGFRGEESDADEELVRDTCARWKVPLSVHRADAEWRESIEDRSVQEVARDLRYRKMLEVARDLGSQTVAVAHHRDDQVETILLRLFRGTGVQGLAAMRPRRPLRSDESVMLVRPLLFAFRREIQEYVSVRGIPYRDDRSNSDERFDRVKLRRAVLPVIRVTFGESALRNIGDAAERMQEIVDDGIVPFIESDLNQMVDEQSGSVLLDLESLRQLPEGRRRLVLLLALQRYLPGSPRRASVIERTEALIAAEPGKRLALDSGTVWRDRHAIVLVREPMTAATEPWPIRLGVANDTSYGSLTVERIDPKSARLSRDEHTEVADGRVLDRPLSLGPWFPGERFQPLGFSGTKKISDFLTDAKVPTYLRHSTPVLRSGRDVVWILGLRLAHPFRLTPESTSAVRFKLETSA